MPIRRSGESLAWSLISKLLRLNGLVLTCLLHSQTNLPTPVIRMVQYEQAVVILQTTKQWNN